MNFVITTHDVKSVEALFHQNILFLHKLINYKVCLACRTDLVIFFGLSHAAPKNKRMKASLQLNELGSSQLQFSFVQGRLSLT